MTSSLRHVYHEELGAVVTALLDMTDAVRLMVHEATEALLRANIRVAERVVSADDAVDQMRREVDARCVHLLARQAPVAGDLRLVIAAMRIAADLERMGDLSAHVAKVARLRAPESAIPEGLLGNFAEMGRVAEEMVVSAGTTMRHRMADAGDILEEFDEEMDDLRASQFRVILGPEWPYGVEAAVDVALLGRYYERIADHAVALARRVAYLVTGEERD